MKTSRFWRVIIQLFLASAALGTSANSCHLGSENPFEYDTEVFVYSDSNANDAFDVGEKPVPNAVVTLQSFPPREEQSQAIVSPLSMTYLTDETGKVILQGKTFRYYEAGVLTPCGYHPKIITRQRFSKNTSLYQVGFIPDQPRAGSSSIEIHFWLDQNGDGLQNVNEMDMANTNIQLSTMWEPMDGTDVSGGSIGYYFDLVTDEKGRVKLNLGNVCQRFRLGRITLGNKMQAVEVTFASPNVKAVDYSSGDKKTFGYEFNSAIGKNSLELGVRLKDF